MVASARAQRAAAGMRAAKVTTAAQLLDGQVSLDVACLDRIYLNVYVPTLQVGGQVVTFLTRHLGHPIPSPAIFDKIGRAFDREVDRFLASTGVPLVRFAKHARKADVMAPYLKAAAKANRPGVVAVGVAQEFQRVFTGTERRAEGHGGPPQFSFAKSDRRVKCYYFYVFDADFGPGFIKICTYFPYPAKIWVNGHEWAKRQAARAGIAFTELSNGFASCADAGALQEICDSLGPADIEAFADRWLSYLPTPLSGADRAGGYWWEASMRQVEVSRTLVFRAPRHARAFFEELVTDNLGMGRPDEISLIFDRRIHSDTETGFLTQVVSRDVGTTVNFHFHHSRIKEYLKDGRALRVETVVNSPTDLGVKRRLEHLPELVGKARDANDRLLHAQRVGQGCVLASPAFERIALSSLTGDGRRAPALRFGDPRVMALAGALSAALTAVTGFTNRSLRAQVAGMLGGDYSPAQMGYDLQRLRLNGIIERLDGTNTYRVTADGQRFALFYTKVHHRVLRPLLAADGPPAPAELRTALHTIDRYTGDYVRNARIGAAA